MLKHLKRNRKALLTTMVIGAVVIVTTMSSRDNENGPYAPFANEPDWEQSPPIANKVMIQQLDKPLGSGENVLLEIAYPEGAIPGTSVALYVGGDDKIIFNDDGINGDVRAKDNTFTAYIKEDIDGFTAAMEDYNRTLAASANKLMVFTGRTGRTVKRRDPFFDKTAFNSFRKVEISRDIFSLPAATSGDNVTAVIEDEKFNPYPRESVVIDQQQGTINPINIGSGGVLSGVRGSGPPPPPPTILKENSLLITNLNVVEDVARTFNPCTNAGNPNGAWTFKTLMKGLANQTTTGITAKEFVKHWVRRWTIDTTVNGEFVRNRATQAIPLFIKPWIDKARGSTFPAVTLANWQGFWDGIHQDSLLKYAPFKLTAIVNRLDLRGNFGYAGSAGNAGETRFIFSVIRNNGANCSSFMSNAPFDGFNVIFEYGNVQKTCAQVKAFALQWANLSTMALGSNGYKAALEVITHTVTDSNVVSGKPNKAALNQIRTNEIAMTNASGGVTDKSPRWQFREFKIQSNKHLEQVPTANEPAGKFNGADAGTLADVTVMANWVNTNSTAIKAQTLAVPATLPGPINFLAGKVNYKSPSPTLASGFWDGRPGAVITDDSTREIFSLNTCTGCHSMEPKTVFTHIDYVGFTTPMNYQTTINVLPNGSEHKTRVSPFLTGVDVIFNGATFVIGDDSTSVAEDATDATLTGFFWARDPANRTYPGTGIVRKWGFNDLERRSQDLTNLLNSTCSSIKSLSSASIAFFSPLKMTH